MDSLRRILPEQIECSNHAPGVVPVSMGEPQPNLGGLKVYPPMGFSSRHTLHCSHLSSPLQTQAQACVNIVLHTTSPSPLFRSLSELPQVSDVPELLLQLLAIELGT